MGLIILGPNAFCCVSAGSTLSLLRKRELFALLALKSFYFDSVLLFSLIDTIKSVLSRPILRNQTSDELRGSTLITKR